MARGLFDGTTVLALMLERFAPGGATVEFTRSDVESARFMKSHPVVFDLIDVDTIRIRVQRPAQDTPSDVAD